MNAYLLRISKADSVSILGSADTVRSAIKHAYNDTHRILNLGESWCGIHFVITGDYPIPKQEALQRGISWDDDSLENVLMGGSPTPYHTSVDVSRYLKPKEVAQMAEKLSNLTVEQFEEWYDSQALMEEHIPPEIWNEKVKKVLVRYVNNVADFSR